jgi:8-oxo-dGTP pyrophosphatase MutT (NUDIX family)
MHKAFINNKPLIFENVYEEVKDDKNFLILSEAEFQLTDVIKKIEESDATGVVYLCSSPDVAWNNFTSRYILMEAAGGIVRNENEEVLVIFRNKHWDLPKGKLDYQETPEEAAIREVKEECGLKNIRLEKYLLKTFHTYTEKNKFILKKTHWFRMITSSDEILIPQQEENIEKVRWMKKEKIYEKVFPSTFESIKEVFEIYFNSSNNK